MSNKVELIGYYGSDQVHALSAWTSTSRDLTDEKKNRIPTLLKMLAEKNHHSVFEKSSLHFLVDTDIASHIHLLKHRIGVSINGESARYKEIKEDKYLIPDDWPENWKTLLENHNKEGNRLYHKCISDLVEIGYTKKRAKESARFFKSYSSQIQADILFNWRSFYHFLNLRNKPESQKEIREIADHMLQLVKDIEGNPFEYTLSAFNV
jgi:flavin-dependent thymidylate synthase